jgi:valyl-tRNA synthetase
LFDYKVPVIQAEEVDPEFGSGIVMICTFGDTQDINWWKTHKLDLKIVLNRDGTLNEKTGKYKGMKIVEAKEKILEDLKNKNLLTKSESLTQTVGCCWRCGTPVEYLTTEQWFIKTLDFKEKIIKKANEIKWYPKFMKKRLIDWTNNLKWDWCISRQRFYGVPIPVWYCKNCRKPIIAEESQLPLDPEESKPRKKCECGSSEFEPEHDVFDTWMTSSMTPQIACKWLSNPKLYKKLYSMSLRPQSNDIIRSWAFYTILKSLLLFDSIPWKEIMIGTFVLDEKGKGMSKSKGNVVWLKDILEKYNADAIRYWTATASIGESLPFKEAKLTRGNKLLTKLWNAARLLGLSLDVIPKKPGLEIEDKWILSRLKEVSDEYKKYFRIYRIDRARELVETFFKHEFCDFYLEMIKYRLYGKNEKTKKAAKWTLYNSLYLILQLFAPIISHLTEEIYQTLFRKDKKSESLHLIQFEEIKIYDKKSLELGRIIQEVIAEIRKWKKLKNLRLGAEVKKLKVKHEDPEKLEKVKDIVKSVMRIENLEIKKGNLEVSE